MQVSLSPTKSLGKIPNLLKLERGGGGQGVEKKKFDGGGKVWI